MAANRLAKHTVPVPSHSRAVGMRNRIRAAPISFTLIRKYLQQLITNADRQVQMYMESFLLYVISSPYFYKLKIDLLKSPSSANALTLADSTFVKSSLRLNAIANSCTVIKTILTLLPFANVVNASSEKPEKLMNNPLVKPDFEDTFSLKTTKSALSIFLFVHLASNK